jgi:starch synthase
MRLALIASEMVPMIKVGGLADTVGSFAGALKGLGHQVTVFIPYYGTFDLDAYSFARRLIPIRVKVAGRDVDLDVYECRLGSGIRVWALGCPEYLERGTAYTEGPDEPVRFGVFSKAVASLIGQEADKFDLVHCHDWHAALVPFFLKVRGTGGEEAVKIPVVLTIHTLSHQGLGDKEIVDVLDLGRENFTASGLEFYGKANFFKAGLLHADAVTTVSANYAREVLGPLHGTGLEGVLGSLKVPFRGILNGIDASKWDPSKDGDIPQRFGPDDLKGKAACKAALQREMGLPQDPSVTLLGVVARLTAQKGIDLIMAVAPRLLRSHVQLVILGEGQKEIEERLVKVMRSWKGRVAVTVSFDEKLSRRIYAGSDLFLSPSRFEPCGISVMIAMRYGAVPVARATGGLADTVVDVDRFLKTGSGFAFDDVDPVDFLGAVLRGVTYHQSGGEWSALVKRVMSRDYSWKSSAKKYEALYQEVLGAVAV